MIWVRMRTTIISPEAWADFKANISSDSLAGDRLASQANNLLKLSPIKFTDRKHVAPSGDPHDYVSISVYTWPDPRKPDGLPWKTRDGEPNPVFYEYDSNRLECLSQTVKILALQAYSHHSTIYAEHAAQFLSAWFIDPETRMNPHLQYAQFVPGKSTGQTGGIIDTTSLVFLLEMIRLLEQTPSWNKAISKGVRDWFKDYLKWLLTSPRGQDEGSRNNNHGTWYDAQVLAYAMFIGDFEFAKKHIETTSLTRIETQIEPDGSQPHELKRTLSLTYCTYNLLAFACIARFGKELGVDVWGYKNLKGASLKSAMKFMLPYYSGAKSWPFQQIHPFDFSSASLLINLYAQDVSDQAAGILTKNLQKDPWDCVTFSKGKISGRDYKLPN